MTPDEYDEWWFDNTDDDGELLADLAEPARTLAAHVAALRERIDKLPDPTTAEADPRGWNTQCACAYDHPDAVCVVHAPQRSAKPTPRRHPMPPESITFDDITALMRRLDIPPPRQLHCGRAAWEVIKSVTDKTTDVLGMTRDSFDSLGLYGTPVIVKDDMPDGAWRIVEGERVVIEGDFAPGHRRAIHVPGIGLFAFSDEVAALMDPPGRHAGEKTGEGA